MTLPEDTILERRYRIDGLLTHGGMGAIYRAFDTNLSTPVAIKENLVQTPQRVAQFKQEALMLARLRHPSLPRVIHHFSFEGQQYLVMDFIEGQNLWELVEQRGEPLAEAEALDYIMQVCQAVNYLHHQTPPIVHRDIKPQNIKVTPDGRAMLVDFGIAKQSFDNRQAQVGAQGVTAGFSPPKQYSGDGTTLRSDIYALGATLYAVLTGTKPPNSVNLMAGSAKFKAPNLINPKLSQQVTQAIVLAMQPQPQNRPTSVAEWQQKLEAIGTSKALSQLKEDATLISQAALTGDAKDTLISGPTLAQSAMTTLWLVDWRGIGYPLGGEPLQIGRHPQADVIVDDTNVSRLHARVKIEDNHCFVRDENSANGTLISGHRLQAEWHPFSQSDVLMIGPVRFYLTSTRPVKLAPPKVKTILETTTQTTLSLSDTGTMATQRAGYAKKSARTSFWAGIFMVILIALLGVGAVVWFTPTLRTRLTARGSSQTLPTATLAQTQAIAHATETAQAQTGLTAEAQQEITATADAQVSPIATLAGQITSPAPNPTMTAPPTFTSPTKAALDTLMRATAPLISATVSVTASQLPTVTQSITPSTTLVVSAIATATATVVPQPSGQAAGPTPVPLKSTITVAQLGTQEVIDVDLNPQNPNEVFAVVKRDGIYKSINGGDGPWLRVDLDGSAITSFTIDPSNPLRLYAPTWNAVLKSVDGGNTWDAITNGLVANRTVDVVVVHPAAPDVLYGGIGETLVVSVDQGLTWTSTGYGKGLGVAKLHQIVIDPFTKDVVYVAGEAAAMYKSDNSGRDFIQLPVNVGQAAYGLVAHPSRKGVYLAGVNSAAAGVVKSEDGFAFRSASTGLIFGGGDSVYVALAYAPSNPDIVYVGSGLESASNARGIFKSSDGGENWARINSGLAINPTTNFPYYVKSMVVHPTNPNIVLAATGSGLYKSVDGGQNWSLR